MSFFGRIEFRSIQMCQGVNINNFSSMWFKTTSRRAEEVNEKHNEKGRTRRTKGRRVVALSLRNFPPGKEGSELLCVRAKARRLASRWIRSRDSRKIENTITVSFGQKLPVKQAITRQKEGRLVRHFDVFDQKTLLYDERSLRRIISRFKRRKEVAILSRDAFKQAGYVHASSAVTRLQRDL